MSWFKREAKGNVVVRFSLLELATCVHVMF
jgi:hypothetical protein